MQLGHPQRNRTWATSTADGQWWLKLGSDDMPVAGIGREIAVLEGIDGELVPKVVVSGRVPEPFLLTVHIPGTACAALSSVALAAALPSIARSLQQFGTARVPSLGDGEVADWDLFGARPDIGLLLGAPGMQYWSGLVGARLTGALLAGPSLGHGPMSVHGSFDGRNVLVEGSEVAGLIDLEATRPGPVEIDAAGFADDIVRRHGQVFGRAWLDLLPSRRFAPRSIAGFLALRLWHRHEAVGIEDRHVEDARAIVVDLLS